MSATCGEFSELTIVFCFQSFFPSGRLRGGFSNSPTKFFLDSFSFKNVRTENALKKNHRGFSVVRKYNVPMKIVNFLFRRKRTDNKNIDPFLLYFFLSRTTVTKNRKWRKNVYRLLIVFAVNISRIL